MRRRLVAHPRHSPGSTEPSTRSEAALLAVCRLSGTTGECETFREPAARQGRGLQSAATWRWGAYLLDMPPLGHATCFGSMFKALEHWGLEGWKARRLIEDPFCCLASLCDQPGRKQMLCTTDHSGPTLLPPCCVLHHYWQLWDSPTRRVTLCRARRHGRSRMLLGRTSTPPGEGGVRPLTAAALPSAFALLDRAVRPSPVVHRLLSLPRLLV